jgi:hypothetical protein
MKFLLFFAFGHMVLVGNAQDSSSAMTLESDCKKAAKFI